MHPFSNAVIQQFNNFILCKNILSNFLHTDSLNSEFPVTVIGGGLAGLSLSILAAQAGYRVALFEKEHYPFHKVCGEYISFESYDFMKRLGLPLDAWQLPVIKKLELSDIKGRLYSFPLDMGGFGISRYTLDNALYKIAEKEGVHVFTGTKVNDIVFENDVHSLSAGTQKISSSVCAAAFGKRTNLDVKWKRDFTLEKPNKLNNYIGVKYHIRYNYPIDTIALHNFKNGYCGISNIEDGKCCLCYLTVAENLSACGNSIKAMEEKILFQNPLLKKIFTGAEFLYEQPLAISQISFSKKTQTEEHILMLGDAAGLITPLCGNGMSMAMHSARLAFENIHLFLQRKMSRKEMEGNYTKQWQQTFAMRLMAGRVVQKLTGNNFSTSAFLSLLGRFPFLASAIIKSTHGERF